MKTLEELARDLVTHKEEGGVIKKVVCSCSHIHIFYKLPTTRYLDCHCGKRVKLCQP